MKGQIWEVLSQNTENDGSLIEKALNIPTLAASVLSSRGYTPETAKALISGEGAIHSPMLLKDMDKAIELIFQVIEEGGFIAVFGDYDCDGVTATAMLKSYFDSIGARNCFYIPHRENEGYGLNIKAIDELNRLGVNLIITVDNGISAYEEVEYANQLGMQVIITDHHRPPEQIPNAYAVVNPHQKDCNYPFKELCGAGVAFKLICALEGDNGEEMLEEYADFLAIGTVADVVPLIDENRVFVKRGVELLSESHREGVNALLKVASLEGKQLTSDSIAFGIAPRINAAGRLDTAETAVMLLLCEYEEQAKEIAELLEKFNADRKIDEKQIAEDIAKQIEENPALLNRRILSFFGKEWNAGIAGIVCSRITEKYGKPCMLVSVGENGEAKGSGRSVEGFSLINAITACKNFLTRFGGHPMAAGFSLLEENVLPFFEGVEAFAKNTYAVMPTPKIKVDCDVSPKLLTLEQVKGLSCLAPFGSSNPSPVFMVSSAVVDNVISLSEGKHLKLKLAKDGENFEVISFFTPPESFCVGVGDKVDVAFSASINEYMGKQSVSLMLKAIRLAKGDISTLVKGQQQYESHLRKELDSYLLIPTREEIALVYRYIKSLGKTGFSKDSIYCHIIQNDFIEYPKFRVAFDVMQELNLIKEEFGKSAVISINPSAGKVNLESSNILRNMRQSV